MNDVAEFVQAITVAVDTVLFCRCHHLTWPSLVARLHSCQTRTVLYDCLPARLQSPPPKDCRAEHSSVGIDEAESMSMAIHVNLDVGRDGIGF